MELTIKEILSLAGDLTVVGTLVAAVYLFMTGKLIPRAVYEELLAMQQALTKVYLRDLSTTVTTSVVEAVQKLLETR